MKRRRFIAAGAGLSVALLPGCALPVIPKRPKPEAQDALGWINHARGGYTLFLPRIEMGQHILTALKQVACQELGIPWDRLDTRLPSTRDIARVRATVGSDSVKDFALPLAQACATLREALAAGQTQGRLVARPWPREQLRAFRSGGPFVGRTVALEQARAIVTGAPLYAADVRRPGQLFGRVLRAPASPELTSTLLGADEAAARRVSGFVALVRDPLLRLGNAEGLGLVARTPGALDAIARALVPRWQVQGGFEQADIDTAIDIDRHLAAGARLTHKVHDDAVASDAAWDVDLRMDIPLAAHAPIEPRAAVAEWSGTDTLTLWAGTQDAFYVADVLARRLALSEERITVHPQRVGGAFGGKTLCTVELEAALLARAAGAPVKLQWTREQEFRHGFHRPPSSHRVRARLRNGRLHDWQHAFASSHILLTSAALSPWLQKVSYVIGDDGVARGAALPYVAGQRSTRFELVRLPVFTGPWRGLGAGPNGLVMESAIDECARKAGADAVQWRLDHLSAEPRLARVLARCAAAAGWAQPLAAAPAGHRAGRGVACGIYKGSSYAAVVAELWVDTASGAVRVRRMVCAHDCGLVINPDQVRAQCEGNLVWGLGMVLVEALPVAASQVAGSFAESPLPRLSEVPAMQVVLVDEGDAAGGERHAPGGAGETAIVAAGAAVANAVRDAIGLRVQRVPLQPADVLRALAA